MVDIIRPFLLLYLKAPELPGLARKEGNILPVTQFRRYTRKMGFIRDNGAMTKCMLSSVHV